MAQTVGAHRLHVDCVPVLTDLQHPHPVNQGDHPMNTASVKPIPEGFHTVTPHLVCANANEAMDFYKKAFNAVETARLPGPDGKLMHGCIRIGNSTVMLVDESPEWRAYGPKSLKGSPVTIHLYVEDADSAFARAVEAGATAKMAPEDMFWGDRYGVVEDPYGHNWSIATHQRDVTAEDMQKAMQQMQMCPEQK
jgi:uncharacterized glyoxalase superfamily protein PhnB